MLFRSVGMIIEKLNNKDLPSRITDMNREKAQLGESLISKKEREERFGQKGQTIWITGLAGSGKGELAYILERRLFDEGKTAVVFDGQNVRAGLSQELDFTPSDRAEHLRRVAHMCNLLNNQGIITICAFRSPDSEIREQIKEIIGNERFTLIYMDETIESCKAKDTQLYADAEEGLINDVPGVDISYDIPADADYSIST